jgi:hypothetical protein
VEFVELNFDFHPRAVFEWLAQLGFKRERVLTLSHFRVGFLKRIIPTGVLVFFDSIFQWTGALFQLTPSVFVKAVVGGQLVVGGEKVDRFFKCPECGRVSLEDKGDHLLCECGKKWEVSDGIYDFREAMK